MPSVAAKTVQFNYSESFDDGILNSSPWSFGGTHGRPGWGTVTEHNGFLDIQNAVTDNGGKATVAFQTGVSNAVISMDRYYHAANSYYFGDTVMSFTSATGANVIVALRMQKSSWAPDYESNPNNFNRPKLIVDDQIGTSVFTYGTISSSSLYNQWINTDISIDNLTGAVSIDLNSDGITDISIISAALVGAKLDSIDFNSYGWYTGHYSYLDNLTVNGTTTLPTLRTADSIFKTEGELAFLSRLALAAYSLNLFENTGLAINNGDGPNGPSTLAFSGLGSFLRLLTPTELRGTGLHYANPTSFGLNGLHNGIFTTRNAAALVAQSKDALFVSFRGTNDNAGVSLPSLSPDQQDWVHQPLHYSQFNRLFDAISLWLAANPLITTIYVTGHSLGASMAQAFSQDPRFAGMNIEATAFASPGYSSNTALSPNATIFNLWVQGDLIQWPATFNALGTGIELLTDVPADTSAHSMLLYADAITYLEAIGAPIKDGFNGVVFNKVWTTSDITLVTNGGQTKEQYVFGVGDDSFDGRLDPISLRNKYIVLGGIDQDSLVGGRFSDYISGGAGLDTLDGYFGDDFIFGGSHSDLISGGKGSDLLWGGGGVDTFLFLSISETNSSSGPVGADRVKDFNIGGSQDILDLSGIDAKKGILHPFDQQFSFIGITPFSNSRGELRYEVFASETHVTGDENGDGIADFTIVLDGQVILSSANFIL